MRLASQQTKQWGQLMYKQALVASVFALGVLTAPANADWGGLYVGGHAGGAWGDIDTTTTANTSAYWDLSAGGIAPAEVDGVLGGAQIGYDFKFSGWVFGIELGGSFADLDQSLLSGGDDVYTVEANWLANASARAGWLWNGRTLLYVKGGYAMGEIETAAVDTVGPNTGSFSTSERHSGWLAGGGVEHMISDDLSFGVEYNYIDLGETDHRPPLIVNDVDVRLHTVTARLNWHFWSP
jgi:outer membrane immunogenic protein